MKLLKVISLGITLWGLTLIWPDINRGLTEPITLRVMAGLTCIMVGYIIAKHLDWFNNYHTPGQHRPSNQNHASRPIPVIVNR